VNARRVAWTLFALTQVAAAASLVLLYLTRDAALPDDFAFRGFEAIYAVSFSTIGALIVARRRNLVGWIMMLVGALNALQGFSTQYATFAFVTGSALPLVLPLAWIRGWIWFPTITGLMLYVSLLFPDGTLRSRWGRGLALAGAIWIPLSTAAIALMPGPISNVAFLENPLGLLPWTSDQVLPVIFAPFQLLALGALADLVMRYRAARGATRQQIKWFAYAMAIVAFAFTVGTLNITASIGGWKPYQYLDVLSIVAIPLGLGIAILRYRLYDIDLLINRTLVYGALSAVLALTYFALVLLFQSILRPLTGGSEIAVAASTLAVIALVQPLRARIQKTVDRRFYRSHYDGRQIVDSFTARLRDEVDLDDVRTQLLAAVHATVQPRGASVWLREHP
jgi:hypothetical protein